MLMLKSHIYHQTGNIGDQKRRNELKLVPVVGLMVTSSGNANPLWVSWTGKDFERQRWRGSVDIRKGLESAKRKTCWCL